MKVTIDRQRCQGHARCAAVAPDLFALDENGYIAIDGFEATGDQEAIALRGARACPEKVVTLEPTTARAPSPDLSR